MRTAWSPVPVPVTRSSCQTTRTGHHGTMTEPCLGEVAADGSALVVGDRQVQVVAVLRQGPGEGDDLERTLPSGVLGAAGKPQSNAGGCRRRSAPARADASAQGERQFGWSLFLRDTASGPARA